LSRYINNNYYNFKKVTTIKMKQLNNFFIILIVLILFNFLFIHPSLADPCIPNSNNDSGCEGPLDIYSGINITNSGTITATSDEGNAYGIAIGGNDNTITNSGTITATSDDGNAYGIDIAGNDNTITNSGTITVTANGNAYGINNSSYDNGNTIANSGTITVTSNNGYAFGIDIHNGENYIITNSGTITSIVTTGDDGAYGAAITSIGDEGHVFTNSGRINATSAGYSIGIDVNGNYNEILNSGTITSTSTATSDNIDGYYQYAWGILSDGDYNTITNSGTITSTSADTFAFGIVFDSPDGPSDHNVIINSGTITVTSDNDYASGIYGEGHNNQITNSGTIKATSNNGTSTGIDLIGNNNTITNSGKIIANEAILFEGNSNTLNILPNSYISGIITLPGDTTVNITTGPSHSIYYNLGVTPTFSGPTPGFISGTRAATFDPTVFKGSINELADLNNNIASVANKNLSNFKDRQFSTSVFASQLEHKADAVNLKQEIDQLGVVFAYDYKLADTNLNFMAGYANSDLEANSRFAKSYANKSKGPFIGVAGIYDTGLVNVNFGLTTGLLKHSHDRFVNDNEETNGEDHAKANYDSMFIAPEIGVSTKIKSNDITFSPKANVRYNYQTVDGYTETGSNSNATVKSLDVGLVETNLELAGTKSLNQSSYTIKTGYLNRQSVGDHKATVTMIGQTNSIGFGDKSNNIYYAGVGADLNLANFKLSFDLNQYLGDAEGFQGMVKLSNNF
jgi:hypothetical protein